MNSKLQDLKKRYRGEWLAVSIPGKDHVGRTAKLLAHHIDKKTLHQLLRKKKIKDAYNTFAGVAVKPGYAVMFYEVHG